MFLWHALLVSDRETAFTVFQSGLVLHWVAALTLLGWTGLSWIFLFRAAAGSENKHSRTHDIFRRLMRDPAQRWAFRGLAGMILAMLLCPLIIPEDPLAQHDLTVTRLSPPFHPLFVIQKKEPPGPDDIHGDTRTGCFLRIQRKLLNPGLYRIYADNVMIRDDTVLYRQGNQPGKIHFSGLHGQHPESSVRMIRAWMGRDHFGRDVLSRLVAGARISFAVSLLSVMLSVLIGIFIGAVAGYSGRKTDALLMRFVDMMLAFPVIFLILLIMGLWGPSPGILIAVIGLSGWMGIARLVRGETLSVREKEYILAARALGFGRMRILFRHILPNAMTPVMVAVPLRIGTVIIIEAGLSFLGLGIQPPVPSWGNMIQDGRAYLTDAWWISSFPGLALVITVILVNLLGDGLRDARDPRIS